LPSKLAGADAVIQVRDVGAAAVAQAASAAVSVARVGRLGFIGSTFFALKVFEKWMLALRDACDARPNA